MLFPNTLPFMDPTDGIAFRSADAGIFRDETGLESIQFSHEIRQLITVPHENASSFTALLELPATEAMNLLHVSESGKSPANFAGSDLEQRLPSNGRLTFPSNPVLMERAARFSVAATEQKNVVSPESSSIPSNSNGNLERVKAEPADMESSQPLVSDPTVNNWNQSQSQNQNDRSGKRKEREKKVKGSAKKSKSSEDAEKLPYVHVRARRGQATDSHSLAERARREKINARMKLLQELVPGCSKIQGTALVLDEIINHVQSLQRQVEVLSMRLAAVNPRIDFNLDSVLAAESGSLMDSNLTGMVVPMPWPDITGNGQHYQHQPQWPFDAFHQPVLGREDDYHNFITSDNSLSSYGPSKNSD